MQDNWTIAVIFGTLFLTMLAGLATAFFILWKDAHYEEYVCDHEWGQWYIDPMLPFGRCRKCDKCGCLQYRGLNL